MMMKQVKKECQHNIIEEKEQGWYNLLKCRFCGKTWKWNPDMHYYSDSFIGIFVKRKDGN